ncbi:unnamed protein product [Penicillium olsonii]|nr:unnamed protein product [Penicillium olsonii]
MEGFLRSVLLQLVEQDPTSRLSFHEYCRKRMIGETVEQRKSGSLKWHPIELQRLFETLVFDGSIGGHISIFVDAVDECLDQERDQLIGFLHSIRGKDAERSDRPRIFLTCRLYPVESFVVDFSIRMEEKNQLDIQEYVDQKLRIPGEEESDVIHFKNSLFSQTRGLFLWVVLVVNRVHEMSAQGLPLGYIETHIFNCPVELNGLYKALLGSLRDEELPEAGRLFQWIRFSCRPLLLEEIKIAMSCHLGTLPGPAEIGGRKVPAVSMSDQQMMRRILHLGKGLIEIADTEASQNRSLVRFHHETVKYFMDTCGLEYLNSRISSRRGLDETADFQLANTCISYLSSEEIYVASIGERERLLSDFPFLKYAAEHWIDHAVQAEVKGFGSRVSVPSPKTIEYWSKICKTLGNEIIEVQEQGTTIMHLAAQHGLLSMAEKMMGLPSKLSALGMCRSPIARAMTLAVDRLLLWVLILIIYVSGIAAFHTAELAGGMLPKKMSTHTIPDLLETWLKVILALKCSDDQRALIRKLDGRGSSAMHRAATSGQLGMVKHLCSHKANSRAIDIFGNTPMFRASFNGHLEIVKFLHAHGADADIHTLDDDHWTPIYAASTKGHLEVVKYLHTHGANIHIPDSDHWTPIYAASSHGHLEVVKYLHAHGADIHIPDSDHRTPILTASLFGHLEVVKYLHAHGADIHIPDSDHWTPIYAASSDGHLEVVKYLHAHGADIHIPDSNHWAPIFAASCHGHLEVVKYLHAHGADIHIPDSNHWTPILTASLFGHLEVVKYLLAHGADIEMPGKSLLTPIYAASLNGHLEVVKFLHVTGGKMQTPSKDCWSPLLAASYKGRLEVVEYLIAHGSDIQTYDNDKDLWTPIFTASLRGHLEVVEFLHAHGADIHVPNGDIRTPIYVASENGHLEVVKFLHAHGGDIHRPDKDHQTPMFIASIKGHLEVVEFLHAHGADIHAPNKDNRTPMYVASKNGHLEVVKFLYAHGAGADIHTSDRDGATPIFAASESGHLELIKFICDHGADADIHRGTNDGWTPLAVAAEMGHLEVVRFLYERGAAADTHRASDDGWTPLAMASGSGHLEVVRFLYEHGATADTHRASDYGWTPLAMASGSGYLEVIKFLFEHGADTDIHHATNDGWTPFALACSSGHLEVAKFLYKHGADTDIHRHSLTGSTPLAAASKSGHLEVVKFLYEHGASIKATDACGRTPLSLASARGHLAILQELFSWGAVVNTMDRYGSSPLFLAVRNGHELVVDWFLAMPGASLQLKDNFGHTLLWWAKRCQKTSIADALVRFAQIRGIEVCEGDLAVEPSSMPTGKTKRCDACTRLISLLVACHNCPICLDTTFTICVECFEMGARCLNESHELVLQRSST